MLLNIDSHLLARHAPAVELGLVAYRKIKTTSVFKAGRLWSTSTSQVPIAEDSRYCLKFDYQQVPAELELFEPLVSYKHDIDIEGKFDTVYLYKPE